MKSLLSWALFHPTRKLSEDINTMVTWDHLGTVAHGLPSRPLGQPPMSCLGDPLGRTGLPGTEG